jgi:hypothetical protein
MTSSRNRDVTATLDVSANLPVTITYSATTTLQLQTFNQSQVVISYINPNGDDPVANSDTLFVFEGGPFIPFGVAPVAESGAAQGATSIPAPSQQFGANGYVVAYSVGPSVTSGGRTTYPNVAATAYAPQGANEPPGFRDAQYFSASLNVQAAVTQVITFTYALPIGTNPANNRAYIGLWNGFVAPYGNTPNFTGAINATQNQATSTISGLNLGANAQYTAALFTSGYDSNPAKLNLTTIAAYIYFQTGASLV